MRILEVGNEQENKNIRHEDDTDMLKSEIHPETSKMGSTHALETVEQTNSQQNLMSENHSSSDAHGSKASKNAKPSTGMSLEIKSLYREDPRCPWQDGICEEVQSHDGDLEYALIVRRQKKSDKSAMLLHSIVVQSPLLREVLAQTFEGYEGISTKLRELQFCAPFHEFFYRWSRFEKLYQENQDEETGKHLALLYPVISKEIVPQIEAVQDFTTNGLISFEYLWAIFSPRTNFFSTLDGQDRMYNVEGSEYAMAGNCVPQFHIRCRYIDCDGTGFGYQSTTMTISHFDGIRTIADLDLVPEHLHPNKNLLLEKLLARGEKFEKLKGFHHLWYSGFYFDRSPQYLPRKRHTHESRIIVDSKMFSFSVGDGGQLLEPLVERQSQIDNLESVVPFSGRDVGVSPIPFGIPPIPPPPPFPHIPPPPPLPYIDAGHLPVLSQSLTSDQRLLCAAVVKGFCLSSKRWGEFYVEDIRDIEWNEEAFKRLHLPDDNKDIIHAFVTEQLAQGDPFDDIIRGKGQGLIMLLSGQPGVGKTLTAESVAEEMHKPLYHISAGELGETALDVEHSLESILNLSAKWGAILLLDECDIFLEQRTLQDINRNRLVSTFLRQLEYYCGVMFLTTNRISSIDTAFDSRIHITINYPALDFHGRLHIWKTFINPQGAAKQYTSNLSEEELEKLGRADLNGRQIKNIVKTARLLAKQKGAPLAYEHVEMVLRVKKIGHF